MYPVAEMDLPVIPDGDLDNLHPVPQGLRLMFGFPRFPDAIVRQARAGYYALISYLDEKIGELVDTLQATGQYENTVIIHTSDHGDMNGEHGMWRKSNFYEASSRVPLQVAWPGQIDGGQRIAQVVSLVDVVATICDIAGDDCDLPLDGDSLLPLLTGLAIPTGKTKPFASIWRTASIVPWRCCGADATSSITAGGIQLSFTIWMLIRASFTTSEIVRTIKASSLR